MKKTIGEAETMRQLGSRKGHITRKRSKVFYEKFKKFLEKKEGKGDLGNVGDDTIEDLK